MVSYTFTVTILAVSALCGSLVRADVSHLGYNRFSRPSSTRLQRLESNPTPYPAAGYRPNREFNLPREQPLFPLGNQQPLENKQNGNNGGFDVLSEPQQPQVTYGAPSRFRQAPARVQQQPQQVYNSPQLTYGTPQVEQGQEQEQQSQAQPQPQPQTQNNNNAGFDNQSEPQRPDSIYGAPARFRQAPARLQEQQPQQFYAAPQAERLRAAKPARLTDDREDKEDDEDTNNQNAETAVDIETDNIKVDGKKSEAPQNVATVAYYPAGAFSFVQPVSAGYVTAPNAAYVTAPNGAYVTAPNGAYVTAPNGAYVTAPNAAYVTAQNAAYVAATRAAYVGAPRAAYVAAPASAYQSSFVAASPFVQQQPFTFAAPAQLRAW